MLLEVFEPGVELDKGRRGDTRDGGEDSLGGLKDTESGFRIIGTQAGEEGCHERGERLFRFRRRKSFQFGVLFSRIRGEKPWLTFWDF